MKTLVEQLEQFLVANHTWWSKGDLTRKRWVNLKTNAAYIAETVGRTLRTMQEDHVIACKYEGKNTLYKWLPLERRGDYRTVEERAREGREEILFKSKL
jgi:hypothetical protein